MNLTTESILGCLEISFASEISPQPFTLASDRFLWQGLKAATFFAKISQRMVASSVASVVSL